LQTHSSLVSHESNVIVPTRNDKRKSPVLTPSELVAPPISRRSIRIPQLETRRIFERTKTVLPLSAFRQRRRPHSTTGPSFATGRLVPFPPLRVRRFFVEDKTSTSAFVPGYLSLSPPLSPRPVLCLQDSPPSERTAGLSGRLLTWVGCNDQAF